MARTSTLTGRLGRAGCADPLAAAAMVESWGSATVYDRFVEALRSSPDADLSIAGLNRLMDESPSRVMSLTDAGVKRLVQILGISPALGLHLAAHPHDLDVLSGDVGPRTRSELIDDLRSETADGLRLAYRRAVLRIAARDLSADDPEAAVEEVSAELADLADAVVATAYDLSCTQIPESATIRLGIVALGKCGARELNYVSDVDVLYIAEPARDADGHDLVTSAEAIVIASKVISSMSRICSAHTAAGTIWQLDAALRPEGKAGPLARTLESHRAYYENWAKDWEFQAMLKARPMAGDLDLASAFVDMVWPKVWDVASHEGFVHNVQAMRKRVISLIPARAAESDLKLSAGGLRDTEFSVQLLQLVHGRSDERLRLRGTFEGLRALVAHGYVGRTDGASLDAAYRFQRVIEHRLQLAQLRRTHLVPTDEAGLRRIGRSLKLAKPAGVRDDYLASKRRVLRLHQRLFYSPLLEAVSRLSSEEARLTSDDAATRLRALGFQDASAALRHLQALTQGVTRKAEIQRQLLPAMLGWFAEGPNPDHGLLAFRQVSEALGDTVWYLRALRDEGAMAENLARVLSSSRYAVDLLMRAPQTVQLLSEDIVPRSLDDIAAEMSSTSSRHSDAKKAAEAIRAVRRRELLRLAVGDLLGHIDALALGEGLANVMSATIDAALAVATRQIDNPPTLAVIAMGRWGGRELSYSSDADAMIVMADTDDPDAMRKALKIISATRAMLDQPGPDPALEIDLGLRPEGKGGAMVRSLSSYLKYYETWSVTWESQALLRAAVGAGDRGLAADFLAAVSAVRYPADGLTSKQITDIRCLKARMEAERMPRGQDPKRNVKLGPGGLSDVEWVVQLLQLEHAARVPSLRTANTLQVLTALEKHALIDPADAEALRDSWLLATRVRNATMLLRGKPSDVLSLDVRELAPVSELLGYAKGHSSEFVEEYQRGARLARRVMDRLFWGE